MGRQSKLPPRLPLMPEAWSRPRYGVLWLVERVIGSLGGAFWLACPIATSALIGLLRSCRRTNWTEGVATRVSKNGGRRSDKIASKEPATATLDTRAWYFIGKDKIKSCLDTFYDRIFWCTYSAVSEIILFIIVIVWKQLKANFGIIISLF